MVLFCFAAGLRTDLPFGFGAYAVLFVMFVVSWCVSVPWMDFPFGVEPKRFVCVWWWKCCVCFWVASGLRTDLPFGVGAYAVQSVVLSRLVGLLLCRGRIVPPGSSLNGLLLCVVAELGCLFLPVFFLRVLQEVCFVWLAVVP